MEDKLDLFLKELAELTEKYGIDRCPLVNERGCLIISDENVLDLIIRQQERIEELEIITGLANNRKYYRKFVDEVFCKQKGNELSEPDFDYIYQLYFEQKAKIEKLKWENTHFEFKVDDLNGKLEKFKEYIDIKNGAYEREIERLQSLCTSKDVIIKAQEAEIERLKGWQDLLKAEKHSLIKSEAIKEFAERLESKDTKVDICNAGYVYETIKKVKKEMAGEQNA